MKISADVTAEQKRRIDAAAFKSERRIADFVRRAVLHEVRRIEAKAKRDEQESGTS